jgi:uncharacterized membrane protein YfcA
VSPRTPPSGLSRAIAIWTPLHLAALLTCYVAMWVLADPAVEVLQQIWFIFLVGVAGAIIANATGTGGGVVFLPAFSAITDLRDAFDPAIRSQLDITPEKIVGMSFLIQCFGMSVGALIWVNTFYRTGKARSEDTLPPDVFFGICFCALATCLPMLILTQLAIQPALGLNGAQLLFAFKIFSIFLGLSLLAFSLKHDRFAPKKIRFQPSRRDYVHIAAIGAVGGFVTALFSVGVGEFLAVYLIVRKFPTPAAVAIAVVVSVVTVLSGVSFHLATDKIIWEIVILAIPGAMIGGYVARYIAIWLGSQPLKILAALWIVLSSFYLLLRDTSGVML